MTVLKYDDVIKKSRDLDYYFGNFLKDLMQYHTWATFHSQAFTGSGFIEEEAPHGYLLNAKKAQAAQGYNNDHNKSNYNVIIIIE